MSYDHEVVSITMDLNPRQAEVSNYLPGGQDLERMLYNTVCAPCKRLHD